MSERPIVCVDHVLQNHGAVWSRFRRSFFFDTRVGLSQFRRVDFRLLFWAFDARGSRLGRWRRRFKELDTCRRRTWWHIFHYFDFDVILIYL